MPDTAPPLRRDDPDEREQDQAEARMRLSLERLGTGAGNRHGGTAMRLWNVRRHPALRMDMPRQH